MRYSTEPRHYIFVKKYGFLSFIKDMDNDISKSEVKIYVANTAKNVWIMMKNLLQLDLRSNCCFHW